MWRQVSNVRLFNLIFFKNVPENPRNFKYSNVFLLQRIYTYNFIDLFIYNFNNTFQLMSKIKIL